MKSKKSSKVSKLTPEVWVMSLNASFPRGEEIDFIQEDDDNEPGVVFEFEGSFED